MNILHPFRRHLRCVRTFLLGLGGLVGVPFTVVTQPAFHDRVIITPAPGYTIEWDGNNGGFYDPEIGASAPANEALWWPHGTLTFASSSLVPGGIHDHINVNDGWYGNHSSWIADFTLPDADPFIGLAFQRTVPVRSIAWSRDNGDDLEPSCGGICRDRAAGIYTLQTTRVAAPDSLTPDTGNPATGWATVGTVEYRPGNDDLHFSAYLRHRFDVAENGQPIAATGLRLQVSDPGMAIDEIEVNPPPDPDPPLASLIRVDSAPGYDLSWNGNDGAFSDSAVVPANAAAASSGAVPFAGSERAGFPVARVTDGLFGPDWRPDPADAAPFVGVRFAAPVEVRNLGWSRDNTGANADRALGTYTVQWTRVAEPGAQTVETGDPATGWITLGTVRYLGAAAKFNPHLLHLFRVGGEEPLQATGLRLVLSSAEMAIDQLLVNASLALAEGLLVLTSEPGYAIGWDGNDGDFFHPVVATAPENEALAGKGTLVFASSELEGFGGIHEMKNVNDGVYGNSSSWISGPTLGADPAPFIGLNFGRTIEVAAIAWGRNNGGTPFYQDRWQGLYTLQVTSVVPGPNADTPETGNAATGWVTVGTIEFLGTADDFRPWLRHRFDVSRNGTPIPATGIRILVSNNAIAIDEIEINPPEAAPSPGVLIAAHAGYTIAWDGNDGRFKSPDPGAAAPANLALAAHGTVAFGSSELDFGVHYIRHVNDGLYGNASSWIARFTDPPDPAPFIGLDFGRPVRLRSIAWGRDNREEFKDRALGTYVLQITMVNRPGADTPETGQATTGWATIGTIEYDQETPAFRPWLRHRYDVALADGSPIPATGLRIKPPNNQTAIDEIEVNPAERLTLTPQPGFAILWDGNEGDYYSAASPAPAPDNLALASNGAVAFGSSELDFGVHYIHLINDGQYGNSHSWIADFTWPDPDPFIGIRFNQLVEIGSLAWGRDNGDETHAACGGTCTDRSIGTYTLQITRVATPDSDTPETENPATGWMTVGTVEYTGADGSFHPWLRHRFELAQDAGPLTATGLRIKVSDPNLAIDEIEVFPPGTPPPDLPAVLTVSRQNGVVRLSWTGSGMLQSAPAVDGPWTDLEGAASPRTITPAEGARFYRVRGH